LNYNLSETRCMFTLKPPKNIYQIIFQKLSKKNVVPKNPYVNFLLDTCPENISSENKLEKLDTALNSTLYNASTKRDYFETFCHIQKIYWALNRFAFLCKWKRSQTQVDYDLLLNPISMHKKSLAICLLHEGKKYWFLYRDLLKMLQTALTHSSGFFATPIALKNPFNNVVFNKSILYNIYFGLCSYSSLHIPDIVHGLFCCNFDLSRFMVDLEHDLREYSIQSFVRNLTPDSALREIKDMLKWFNKDMPKKYHITFHDEFPKEEICLAFRHYLVDYFSADYSLIANKKVAALLKLKAKLTRFKKKNPCYGRKILKINKNKKAVAYFTTSFVSDEPRETTREFMKSHLKAVYRVMTEPYDTREEEEFVFIGRNQQEEEEAAAAAVINQLTSEDADDEESSEQNFIEIRDLLDRLSREEDEDSEADSVS
jgi:hypothetical protein